MIMNNWHYKQVIQNSKKIEFPIKACLLAAKFTSYNSTKLTHFNLFWSFFFWEYKKEI